MPSPATNQPGGDALGGGGGAVGYFVILAPSQPSKLCQGHTSMTCEESSRSKQNAIRSTLNAGNALRFEERYETVIFFLPNYCTVERASSSVDFLTFSLFLLLVLLLVLPLAL